MTHRNRWLVGLGMALLAVGCSEPLAVGTEAGGTSSFVVHEDVKQSDRDAYVGPPLEISNELLPGDPDHFSVIIGPGGTSRTMIQDGTDVLFDMFGLIDVPGLGVFDSRDGTLPERVDEGTAQASFTFPCGPGLFDVTDVAVTATILSGEQFLTLDYSFDSACDLTGARFFEYVDLDILFAFDDEFSFIGSIGGGDLVLIQNDVPPPVVGPVVSRVGGALLSGFGSDGFFSLGGNILAGGFDLPPGGDIGLNFGDITSALEYELSGQTFTITTSIGENPIVDAPDSDGDGTPDAFDQCPSEFGPPDTFGCPRLELPPGTEVSNAPADCPIIVDGRFGGDPCDEWADVTPIVELGGQSVVYQAIAPGEAGGGLEDLYLMYDCMCSATPQEPGQLAAVVTFFVGLDQFDVRIVQGGPNSSGGEGDQTLVFRNGVPFNAAGIEGAVDFNVTSPNFPEPHNLVELEVPLLQTDETPGGLPPDQGGIYDPAPSFWGAQVAGSDLIQVSSNIIDIGNGSTTNTTVIPIIEAMEVQVEEAEVQLGRRTRRHRFEAEGTFELGPDGMIDVAGEGVQVRLFGLFDQTLPAGSFVSDDEFEFEGPLEGYRRDADR